MAARTRDVEKNSKDIKVHVEGELLRALEQQARRDFRNPNQQILYILNQYLLEGVTVATKPDISFSSNNNNIQEINSSKIEEKERRV